MKTIGLALALLIISAKNWAFPYVIVDNSFCNIRTDKYCDNRKARDSDQKNVLTHSKSRDSGRAYKDGDQDHQYKDNCQAIYTSQGDRDGCEKFSPRQIERLVKTHEILKDPEEDDLEEIDFKSLDIYLNISIVPLIKHTQRYTSRSAKAFMIWMIKNGRVLDIVEETDRDYGVFGNLLRTIGNWSKDAEMYKPFVTNIDGKNKLIEMAINSGQSINNLIEVLTNSGLSKSKLKAAITHFKKQPYNNEKILAWFQNFIIDKNSDCEQDANSKTCFTVYCKIGNAISSEYRRKWLLFDVYFQDHIDKIISTGNTSISKPCTESENPAYVSCERTITGVEDLDDWVEDLCGGLLNIKME